MMCDDVELVDLWICELDWEIVMCCELNWLWLCLKWARIDSKKISCVFQVSWAREIAACWEMAGLSRWDSLVEGHLFIFVKEWENDLVRMSHLPGIVIEFMYIWKFVWIWLNCHYGVILIKLRFYEFVVMVLCLTYMWNLWER